MNCDLINCDTSPDFMLHWLAELLKLSSTTTKCLYSAYIKTDIHQVIGVQYVGPKHFFSTITYDIMEIMKILIFWMEFNFFKWLGFNTCTY